MLFFWKYTLIFFIAFGFLFTLYLALKKGANLLKNKLFLLLFLFTYNTILVLYSLVQLGNGFENLIVYALSVILLLMSLLIYLYVKHPDRFYQQHPPVVTLDEKNIKYEKTGLSESFSHELRGKLESLMNDQKLYLNHGLKLCDLAEELNISRHHASQVINENFEVSFYEYINTYRIEEAKRLLSSSKKSPICISDIAYQCGFNNRVSFYKAFKKVTNITPKEYLREQDSIMSKC